MLFSLADYNKPMERFIKNTRSNRWSYQARARRNAVADYI